MAKKINSKYLNLFLCYFSIVILYRKFVNTKSNLKLLLVLKNSTLIFHVLTLKKGKEHVFTFFIFWKNKLFRFFFCIFTKVYTWIFFSKMFKHLSYFFSLKIMFESTWNVKIVGNREIYFKNRMAANCNFKGNILIYFHFSIEIC